MYLRGWVHYECPKDIDNLIQFIPDVVFLNKRQDSLHECAVEHSYFFTVLQQFNEHFRLLTGSWSHLLWDIVDPLQISAVSAIGQHCEYIGQEQPDASTAADQLQHDHHCMFTVVFAAVGEAPEDLLQTHMTYLLKLTCG